MLLTKNIIRFNKLLSKCPDKLEEFGTYLKTDGDINFFLRNKY